MRATRAVMLPGVAILTLLTCPWEEDRMAFAALSNTSMWQNRRGTIKCCAPSRGKYALQSNTRLSYGHPNRITGVTILNLALLPQ